MMKLIYLINMLSVLFFSTQAQSVSAQGTSAPGSLNIRREEAVIEIVPSFVDSNKNQALDADEGALFLMTVRNNGPGKAYQVKVKASSVGHRSHIYGKLDEDIGTLEPGQEVEVTMNISADEKLENGVITWRFEAEDAYGRTAQPHEIIMETFAEVPPDLHLIDYSIDDDSQGRSYGNANGKIEYGETIEVRSIIQNKGGGNASNVKVDVRYEGDDIFYMGDKSFFLNDLNPGSAEEINFFFSIPTNSKNREKLTFLLDIAESKGRHNKTETLILDLNQVYESNNSLPVRISLESIATSQPLHFDPPTLTIDIEQDIPVALSSNPNAVAVLIGNRNYSKNNTDVPDVEFAIRDAEYVKEYLVKAMGYKDENILYIKDATTADLQSLFGTQNYPKGRMADLIKRAKSDLFIYYSGHGVPDIDDPKHQPYILPVDCSPRDVRVNGYPLNQLYDNLREIQARSITVVIDACFSGGSAGGPLFKAASNISIVSPFPEFLLDGGALFLSSSKDQLSSWYEEKKHGIFTYFFLKGLRGEADANEDGLVTTGELRFYLSDKNEGVPYWARRLHGREQMPVYIGSEDIVIRDRVK